MFPFSPRGAVESAGSRWPCRCPHRSLGRQARSSTNTAPRLRGSNPAGQAVSRSKIAPVTSASLREAPSSFALIRFAPARCARSSFALLRLAHQNFAPARFAPKKSVHSRHASQNSAPRKSVSRRSNLRKLLKLSPWGGGFFPRTVRIDWMSVLGFGWGPSPVRTVRLHTDRFGDEFHCALCLT